LLTSHLTEVLIFGVFLQPEKKQMLEEKNMTQDELNRELELLIERKKQENLALMKIIKHLERKAKKSIDNNLPANTPDCS